MSKVLDTLRALVRSRQAGGNNNQLWRSFSRYSDALHTIQSGGRPIYAVDDARADGADATPLLAFVTTGNVAAPDATALGLDAAAFGAVRVHWRNTSGGTRTGIAFKIWALTRLGWVRLDGEDRAALAPAVEIRIAGAGYRRLYFEAVLDGGEGEITLYVGGEA